MGKKKVTVNVSATTAKPSGLSISRSGGAFTCSWKICDEDYAAGQELLYSVNNGPQQVVGLDPTATSITLNIGTALTKFEFWVRGRRKAYSTKVTGKKKITTTNYIPEWSEYEGCSWEATVPAAPSLSYSKGSSNSGTFSWSFSPKDNGTDIFDNITLQTCVSTNKSNPPGSGWSTSSVGASGNVTYTETLSGRNVIRWVRVRSNGPAGSSGWTYSHHAYGNPAVPTLTGASASISGSATRVTASWKVSYGILNPVDTVTVQYVTAVPTAVSLPAPASGWSDGIRVTGKNGSDKVIANISEVVGSDECMWVRLKATHDDFSVYSGALLVYKGSLAAPGINATPNVSTGKIAVEITENTRCDVAGTVIFYRSKLKPGTDVVVAVLNHGETSCTVQVDEIKDPSVAYSTVGAYAFVGTYSGLSVSAKMKSGVALDTDILARPPAWLTLKEGSQSDSVRIGWDWTWQAATSAEISWADHDDAWESTDGPSSYTIDDETIQSWVIAKLGVGKRWYFRVRLLQKDDEDEITGPWSETYDYDLSSIPDRPALILSKSVINASGSVTARWAYSSADDTTQEYADICVATIENGEITYGDIVAHVSESQTVEITGDWETGTTYYFCLRVTSTSGRQSEWSAPASLFVAPPVEISIESTNLYIHCYLGLEHGWKVDGEWVSTKSFVEYLNITSSILEMLPRLNETSRENRLVIREDKSEDEYYEYEYFKLDDVLTPTLKSMPMSITIKGAGTAGQSIASVVRAEDYHIVRPDGSDFDGFEGENIVTKTETATNNTSSFSLSVDDLVGYLDDGAKYNLVCTVIDEYGQTASVEIPFVVAWEHQAGKPSATVKMDEYQRIAIITPIAPENVEPDDVCDIYRISADKPELVVKGAKFGTAYVDPYPAFGDFCGHRIVTRTANGDYITAENALAWFRADQDIGDVLEETGMIIDVNGEQIELPYNMELQNSWTKDFKRTAYLGGSVQGDWNPAVTRDISAGSAVLRGRDLDTQIAMRGLAGYAGPAHIRTQDGSSLTCDIQVRETWSCQTKRVSYSLAIKVIDPQQPDGMTYDRWMETHPVG